MCLIVDANVVCLVFPPGTQGEFKPIWEALIRKQAVAVYGGKLAKEYEHVIKLRRLFAELDRAGVLRRVRESSVNEMTEQVISEGICISDD